MQHSAECDGNKCPGWYTFVFISGLGTLNCECTCHAKAAHEHIYGPWFPYDRMHKWRKCVIPGCLVFEKVQVTA